jgi:2-polyprenyl-6-hydroxyphenyl methylase/3-demethylubiquinone-9 3-methyltransferase
MHTYHAYEQPDPPHQPLFLAKLTRHLRGTESTRVVLDAGCGDGNFTHSLQEAGFEMYGIDLSEGGIQRAQARYPICHFAKASVYDDLTAVFPGRTRFDAIVSIEVIEHLYSPRQFALRCHAALRPGGLLIVTTPYWGYWKSLALAVANRMDRSLTALWEGGHIKHWSYRSLRALGEQAGFTFVAFEGAGRPLPFLWRNMVMVFRRPA